MLVSHILRGKDSEIITASSDDSVEDVAKTLGERRIGALLVMEGGTMVGIISERDIVRGIAIRGQGVLADSVQSLMTKSVVTCASSESINSVMATMTERRIRHVPVMDDDQLVGIITIGDVVKERISEAEHEAQALKDYIATG